MLRHRSPIGLDIGASRIKAVQLGSGASVSPRGSASGVSLGLPWRGWQIVATACFDRLASDRDGGVPDEKEMRRMVDVLHRRGFTGRRVVAAVPDSSVLTATAELPPRSSGAPLEQLARVELARAHGKLPDELEAGCWDLPAPSRGTSATSVMTVGCAHEDAQAMLDVLDAAGLDTVALEPRLVSSVRAATTSSAPASPGAKGGGITVLIDLGHASASITVLVANAVVYAREVQECGVWSAVASLGDRLCIAQEDASLLFGAWGGDSGGGAIRGERIARELEAACDDFGARICAEVSTALDYAKYRYSDREVDGLMLYGGAAAIDHIERSVASASHLPVRVLHPTDVLPCAKSIAKEAAHPCLITAAGLAMYLESAA